MSHSSTFQQPHYTDSSLQVKDLPNIDWSTFKLPFNVSPMAFTYLMIHLDTLLTNHGCRQHMEGGALYIPRLLTKITDVEVRKDRLTTEQLIFFTNEDPGKGVWEKEDELKALQAISKDYQAKHAMSQAAFGAFIPDLKKLLCADHCLLLDEILAWKNDDGTLFAASSAYKCFVQELVSVVQGSYHSHRKNLDKALFNVGMIHAPPDVARYLNRVKGIRQLIAKSEELNPLQDLVEGDNGYDAVNMNNNKRVRSGGISDEALIAETVEKFINDEQSLYKLINLARKLENNGVNWAKFDKDMRAEGNKAYLDSRQLYDLQSKGTQIEDRAFQRGGASKRSFEQYNAVNQSPQQASMAYLSQDHHLQARQGQDHAQQSASAEPPYQQQRLHQQYQAQAQQSPFTNEGLNLNPSPPSGVLTGSSDEHHAYQVSTQHEFMPQNGKPPGMPTMNLYGGAGTVPGARPFTKSLSRCNYYPFNCRKGQLCTYSHIAPDGMSSERAEELHAAYTRVIEDGARAKAELSGAGSM